jgi:hypothetical protein
MAVTMRSCSQSWGRWTRFSCRVLTESSFAQRALELEILREWKGAFSLIPSFQSTETPDGTA